MSKINTVFNLYKENNLKNFSRILLIKEREKRNNFFNKLLSWYYKQQFIYQITEVGDNLYVGPKPHQIIKSDSAEIVIGSNVKIWSPVELVSISYSNETKITIGDNVNIGSYCSIRAYKSIKIGSNCLLAPHVQIIDQNAHPLNSELRRLRKPIPDKEVRPVVIEDNVWIGDGAIILPGVTIGQGSVIGASSVVIKDIPAHKIALGNPARVVGWVS